MSNAERIEKIKAQMNVQRYKQFLAKKRQAQREQIKEEQAVVQKYLEHMEQTENKEQKEEETTMIPLDESGNEEPHEEIQQQGDVYQEQQQQQHQFQELVESKDEEKKKIFVSIASYRDPEVGPTVLDLFSKAKHPQRIFVGVCQQNCEAEDQGFAIESQHALQPYVDHIRLLNMDYLEAEGPMKARHLIETHLYENEDFYFVCDSHMLFVQNWDVLLEHEFALCQDPKAVLSTYPNEYKLQTRKPLDPKALACYLKHRDFHTSYGFAQQERVTYKKTPSQPLPSLCWAAGFSFASAEMLKQVPYDPNCPYLFLGEESSMHARLFTHGFNVYSPTRNIVYHLSDRSYRHTFWQQVFKKDCVVDENTRLQHKALELKGRNRISKLLKNELQGDDQYGLGSERSLDDFESFTGVSFRRKTSEDFSLLGITQNASSLERSCKHPVLGQSKAVTNALVLSSYIAGKAKSNNFAQVPQAYQQQALSRMMQSQSSSSSSQQKKPPSVLHNGAKANSTSFFASSLHTPSSSPSSSLNNATLNKASLKPFSSSTFNQNQNQQKQTQKTTNPTKTLMHFESMAGNQSGTFTRLNVN